MRPRVCGCSPIRQRSMVVLPAPLRPASVTIWPLCTSSATSASTRASPYHAERSSVLSMRLPEVSVDDARVVAHFGVGALGENVAPLEHRHSIGEAGDDAHVVLDQHDGPSGPHFPNERDRAVHIL